MLRVGRLRGRSVALALALFAAPLIAPPAFSQVETPAPGTPLRKAVLDSLRLAVAAELGTPIEFYSVDMRVLGEWAFVYALPQRPGGGAISYLYTKYQDAWENGAFDEGVSALLRETPSGWLVYEHVIGATDVPWVDWPQYYPMPPEILPGY